MDGSNKMIKIFHKLYCDNCNEEITDKSAACIVSQGTFIGLDSLFTEAMLSGVIPWHFHLTCYNEYAYQNNSRMPKTDKFRNSGAR